MICGGKFSLAMVPLDLFVSSDSVGNIDAEEGVAGRTIDDAIDSKECCGGLGVTSREGEDDSIVFNIQLLSQ